MFQLLLQKLLTLIFAVCVKIDKTDIKITAPTYQEVEAVFYIDSRLIFATALSSRSACLPRLSA